MDEETRHYSITKHATNIDSLHITLQTKKTRPIFVTFYKKILTSKNTKEIWKIVHRILNFSEKTLNADTNELSKYFNQTATRLIATKIHSKGELEI